MDCVCVSFRGWLGKTKYLNAFERGMVVGARRTGLSVLRTTTLLGFSHSTVHLCVSRLVHNPKDIQPTWHNLGKHLGQHGHSSHHHIALKKKVNHWSNHEYYYSVWVKSVQYQLWHPAEANLIQPHHVITNSLGIYAVYLKGCHDLCFPMVHFTNHVTSCALLIPNGPGHASASCSVPASILLSSLLLSSLFSLILFYHLHLGKVGLETKWHNFICGLCVFPGLDLEWHWFVCCINIELPVQFKYTVT